MFKSFERLRLSPPLIPAVLHMHELYSFTYDLGSRGRFIGSLHCSAVSPFTYELGSFTYELAALAEELVLLSERAHEMAVVWEARHLYT